MLADPLLYGIAAVVIVLLAVGLLVVHRDPHAVTLREAATWTGIWIAVSTAFGLIIPHLHAGGAENPTAAYFTGSVIEESLSVDNVFLFLLIFSALAVPRHLAPRPVLTSAQGGEVRRT
jgi:tellurite resistance protein TerC